MFPTFGHYLLVFALACAIANIGLTLFAYGRGREAIRDSLLTLAHRACVLGWSSLLTASGILVFLFMTDDFSVNYVWGHSSKAQPLFYKFSAFWGGQAGSLLMWAFILGTYTFLVAQWGRKHRLEIVPSAVSILSFVNVFFIGLILWEANPFGLVDGTIPKDGFGLNPLLQNYWMQIHPPTLYTGYVGCTVPFALAMAALLHRKFDAEWVGYARRWTLLTWMVLFVGIVLGGVWAYETLGWGGYWAWDPVENASLMPWLVLTAFVHSIMLQERRGLLKNWNIVLVSLTFLLSIFGTFLTRSGIVSSVHSFAESDIGNYLLGFLGIIFVLTFGLIFYRRDELASNGEVESALSREASFLAANWLWLAAACAVLFGTIYPTIHEALLGSPITVEKGYFNRVMAPLGLLILALAGIGPLFAWRSTSPVQAMRNIRKPVWLAILLIPLFVAPLLYYLGQWHTGAATAFLLCAFLCAAMGQELWRSAKANALWKNRRRTGGYIVHLGLAVFFIGLTGSSVFKIELEPRDLKVGDTLTIGEYLLRFDGFLIPKPGTLAPEKQSDVAVKMTVLKDGAQVAVMQPNVDIYKAVGEQDPEARAGQPEQTARRPAIYSTMGHDLYLALIGYDMEKKTTSPQKGEATIKAYLNPLVSWIWIAVGFFIVGSVIALIPQGTRERVRVLEYEALPVPVSYANGNGKVNGHYRPENFDVEVEIEIAVARQRLRLANGVASWQCECGRTMNVNDNFCASCGKAKPTETSVNA